MKRRKKKKERKGEMLVPAMQLSAPGPRCAGPEPRIMGREIGAVIPMLACVSIGCSVRVRVKHGSRDRRLRLSVSCQEMIEC